MLPQIHKVNHCLFFQVYCRIRPLGDNEEESCVQIISESVLQLTAPKVSSSFIVYVESFPVFGPVVEYDTELVKELLFHAWRH